MIGALCYAELGELLHCTCLTLDFLSSWYNGTACSISVQNIPYFHECTSYALALIMIRVLSEYSSSHLLEYSIALFRSTQYYLQVHRYQNLGLITLTLAKLLGPCPPSSTCGTPSSSSSPPPTPSWASPWQTTWPSPSSQTVTLLTKPLG